MGSIVIPLDCWVEFLTTPGPERGHKGVFAPIACLKNTTSTISMANERPKTHSIEPQKGTTSNEPLDNLPAQWW